MDKDLKFSLLVGSPFVLLSVLSILWFIIFNILYFLGHLRDYEYLELVWFVLDITTVTLVVVSIPKLLLGMAKRKSKLIMYAKGLIFVPFLYSVYMIYSWLLIPYVDFMKSNSSGNFYNILTVFLLIPLFIYSFVYIAVVNKRLIGVLHETK